MHKSVLKIFTSRCCVGFSRKTSQTLFINKDSQRISACQKDVYSEVKFESVDQKRFVKISLHHTFFTFQFWINLQLLSMFLVRKIPRPWQLASGLTIKVWAFPAFRLSWYSFSSGKSEGSIQVFGKKSYYSGKRCLKAIKLLPRLFFRDNISMPGKWFIFWPWCIL